MILRGRLLPFALLALAVLGVNAAAFVPLAPMTDAGDLPDPPWEVPPAPRYDDDVEEQRGIFTFRCPTVATGVSVANDPSDTRLYQACPIRIEDGDDFFGNIQLGVHPENRNHIAFVSLHGHPADDAATPRSREPASARGMHTTFVTTDAGAAWADNPIHWGDGNGEAATITIDSEGNVYVAYLWSRPEGDGNWTSEIIAFKGPPVHEFTDEYRDPEFIVDHQERLMVDRIEMVRLPAFDPAQKRATFAVEENRSDDPDGDGGPAPGGGRVGDAADDRPATPERILLTHRAVRLQEDDAGPLRYIDAAWTDTAAGTGWQRLAHEERIGPCINATQPVAFEGVAYIGCTVAKGYDARPRARIGDLDIWKIDPWSGETEWVSYSGIRGERPQLAITPRGYTVAVAETYRNGTAPEVQVAFGWYGAQWNGVYTDVGPQLNALAGGLPVVDAHVTAVAVSEREKTAFLVYGEWNPPDEVDPQAQDTGSTPGSEDELRKVLVAFNECRFPVGGVRMEVGLGIGGVGYNTTSGGFDLPGPRTGFEPEAFHDLHDGLLYLPGENGEELLYMVLNDYGIAQYAEIVVGATEERCEPVPPLPPMPALAAPAATTLSSASMTVVGSSIGVVAAAMVTYLLTVKRRTAHTTTAEDL